MRIAVIGAGKFGVNLLNAFSQMEREGRCELAAFADVNEAVLRERAQTYGIPGYADYRDMLRRESVGAVAIATPDPLHCEPAVYAAKLGLHVLVEKPMALTEEECRSMADAAGAAGVLLQVDFHKRYDPHHRGVEKLIREDGLGRVEYGYVHMEDRIEVPARWFPGWAPRSSPVWFLGIHFIDLIRWLLKSDGRQVYATGRKWKLKGMGVDTYDSVTAQVEFDCGAAVTFDSSWILPDGFEAVVNQGFRLVGEKGAVECDSQDRGTRSCTEGAGMQTHNPGFLLEGTDLCGNVRHTGYGVDSVADFVANAEAFRRGVSREAIRAHGAALAEDGIGATRIAAAIHASLESGTIVRI